MDLCGSWWIFVATKKFYNRHLWIFVDIASSLIYMLVGLINRPLCMRHIVAISFNHREVPYD